MDSASSVAHKLYLIACFRPIIRYRSRADSAQSSWSLNDPVITPHRCHGIEDIIRVVFCLDRLELVIVAAVERILPVWIFPVALLQSSLFVNTDILATNLIHINSRFRS